MSEVAEKVRQWAMGIAYDKRFGAIALTPTDPDGQPVAHFMLRVSDLLRASGMTRYELAEYLNEAEAPAVPMRDIEEIRREAVERANVDGKVVLDVGGYMGEFAKLALDRGAKRAIVLDTEQWRHYGWEDKRIEGVEYVKGDLMDYKPYDPGKRYPVEEMMVMPQNLLFHTKYARELPRPDVLILFNLAYHVRNPIAFLDRAREIIKPDGEMLLCTLFRYHDGAWVYFYEPRECNKDDVSVFFGPSIEALERWLTCTGWIFEKRGQAFDRVVYACRCAEPQWRESKS